jgi:hypothetical protein
MFKKRLPFSGALCGLGWLCAALAFSACKTSPSREDLAAEASAAAEAALADMGGSRAAAAGEAAPPAVQTGARPAWVDSADAVYSKRQYLAAVGHGAVREMAEKNALAALAAVFGQSVRADQKVIDTYQEAVKNGAVAGWAGSTVLENAVQTSASMDTLLGAEIRNVWYDGKNVYYAAAVMDRAKSAVLYGDMIQANQTMIARLIAMDQAEKSTLEGFSRYQLAAAAADLNAAYGNVLQVLGAPPPEGLKKGDEYRLEAAAIARTIPVGVMVRNDRAGRIQGAFAKALAGLGFRIGGADSLYRLEAELFLSEVRLPNQENKFARYEIAANLVEAQTKTALAPYTINGREGHTTLAEAENRALAAAERKIGEEYQSLLSASLTRLLPKP